MKVHVTTVKVITGEVEESTMVWQKEEIQCVARGRELMFRWKDIIR